MRDGVRRESMNESNEWTVTYVRYVRIDKNICQERWKDPKIGRAKPTAMGYPQIKSNKSIENKDFDSQLVDLTKELHVYSPKNDNDGQVVSQ